MLIFVDQEMNTIRDDDTFNGEGKRRLEKSVVIITILSERRAMMMGSFINLWRRIITKKSFHYGIGLLCE